METNERLVKTEEQIVEIIEQHVETKERLEKTEEQFEEIFQET